jgi:hypothetical protein
MASFSDQISQFNPYIAQLPVEAMVKVGMYKQEKYDQGVQKIQGQIDNIAGMDVANDADKQYLQSKLNELGSKLKTVAAGDFSNNQLVNSVGGMATQIVKDPTVQNAVSSTAWYRKQLAEMETAISEGKSSVANIDDFNEQANTWLSSTTAGKKFNGRYTPYRDVNKKVMEAIKALHPKLRDLEIPFVIENGVINQKKLAQVMQENKIEGVTEGQIATAISAVLDPNDINQLSIDGKYQFKNVSTEQLAGIAKKDYDSQVKYAAGQIEFLRGQKKLVLGDPNKSQEVDDRIAYYEKQLGSVDKPGTLTEEFNADLKSINDNPNAVKASMYKKGFINQYANAFSWQNEEVKYKDSPFEKVRQWKAEQKLKWTTENRQAAQDVISNEFRQKELDLKTIEVALKKSELYGDGDKMPWEYLGDPTTQTNQAIPMMLGYIDGLESELGGLKGQMKNAGYSDGEINQAIEDYRVNGTKATKVPAKILGTVQDFLKKEAYATSIIQKNDQIKNESIKEILSGPDMKALETMGVNMKAGDGSTFKLTGAKLLKDLQEGRANLSIDNAALGKIRLNYTDPTTGKNINIELAKHAGGADIPGGKLLRPLLNEVSKQYTSYNKKIEDRYQENLAPIVKDFIPRIKAVIGGKDGAPPPVTLANLSAMVTSRSLQNLAADANFDPATASSFLSGENKKDTRIFIHNAGDRYEVWLKNEKDPKNIQKMKLTGDMVNTVFGAGYIDNKTQESMRLGLGRGNTNITGDATKAIMQKQFGDFPGINRLQVTADLDSDVSDPKLFIPMINVRKKDGRYQNFIIAGKDQKQRFGYEQGLSTLNGLTDDSLLAILKQSYPNFDFSTLDY